MSESTPETTPATAAQPSHGERVFQELLDAVDKRIGGRPHRRCKQRRSHPAHVARWHDGETWCDGAGRRQ